ncbi:hypothetical protein ABC0459 [Shouchella clausii KSM-K16]|uniref:Uncharacterized protein n=1 Tax=Shouchella clausii (strain KSM-K16) TaxID=66692 RepID=Q5WKV4_SHOC1|nr:hypothetical protein [Shouchella clausii]BAD63001.1 hypothetical protein ABC0459 [Shouchella clausii KSM-K16]
MIFYGAKEMAQNEFVVIGYKVSTKQAPQVIEFVYDVSCVNKQVKGCEIHLEEEKQFALEWVKSIRFSGTHSEGDEAVAND